jgi:hypothetical protein
METAYDFDGYSRIDERKNYQKEVSFSIGSMILPATVKNISMGGALVGTKNISSIKTGAEIVIIVPYATRKGCMKRKAIVKWIDNDHFGIQFI